MPSSRRSIAVLALVSAALAACGGDVTPEEMQGFVIIQSNLDAPGDSIIRAFVGAGDPPDADATEVTVDGELATYTTTNSPGSGGVVHHVFDVTVPTPAPGELFDIRIDVPGGSAELTIPMVQAASLLAPAAPIEIAVGEPVDVAWDASTPEEDDWVYFRSELFFGGIGGPESIDAEAGATSATIPAEVVATWREAIERFHPEQVGQPIHGHLVLARSRYEVAQPALAVGGLQVTAEVARQSVTLLP